MTRNDDEKLIRLLRETSPPTLEPDPHLPTRIRAMMYRKPKLRVVRAPRRPWLPVSLSAAALAVAVFAGAYLGYNAGETVAAAGTATVAPGESTDELAAVWSAWSQAGFAEDWGQLNATAGEDAR